VVDIGSVTLAESGLGAGLWVVIGFHQVISQNERRETQSK
jgi:hypothetical protein